MVIFMEALHPVALSNDDCDNLLTRQFRKWTTGPKEMTINPRAGRSFQDTAPKTREEEDIFLLWIRGCDAVTRSQHFKK